MKKRKAVFIQVGFQEPFVYYATTIPQTKPDRLPSEITVYKK